MNRSIHAKTAALLAAVLTAAAPAPAGILDIIVGITPSCPEGFMGCWGEASQALGMLEGVESVAINPDAYNATASVHLEGDYLPDPAKWREQFQKLLGERIGFRGVEVTVKDTLTDRGRCTPPISARIAATVATGRAAKQVAVELQKETPSRRRGGRTARLRGARRNSREAALEPSHRASDRAIADFQRESCSRGARILHDRAGEPEQLR